MLSPNQITRWNRAHQLFRDEIGRQHEVLYVGPGYPSPPEPGWPKEGPYDVPKLVNEQGPFDCIMTYGLKYSWQFHGMDRVGIDCQETFKAQFICDLVPSIPGYQGTIDPYMKFLNRDKYHMIFALSDGVIKTLLHRGAATKEGYDVFFLPFGVDTHVYKEPGDEQWEWREWDVMTSWSVHDAIYPMRSKINKINNQLPIKHHEARVFGDTFINTLLKSKIGVNASSAYRRWNLKPLEVMACGALCFTDWVEEFKERLNFKDGKHLIIYDDLDDYREKVIYYLECPDEAEKIATAGMNYARRYHSNKIRVEQMTKCLKTMI
jgi:glycosyltransferase involved in cell wall biosynthesis